jgi:hypothetical protein
MHYPKDCEIEKMVSEDPTHLHIAHAHLDVSAKRLVATNGHGLVALPVELEAGDDSGPVSVDSLKAARKAAPKNGKASIHASGALRVANGPTYDRPKLPDGYAFPPWQQIVPEYRAPKTDKELRATNGRETLTFGINVELLHRVALALGAKSKKGMLVKLTIKMPERADDGSSGEMINPIIVESDNAETGAVGVVMPVRI